ncbi:MAG: hypothetical protein AAFR35_06135 [Pseudomonadota bacterium]
MRMLFMVGLCAVLPAFGHAGAIERACLGSDRAAGNRALCDCIQDAANLTLSGTDQQLAASFFKDPHRAQEIRQSSRRTHEVFWERYVEFGAMAETFCRR